MSHHELYIAAIASDRQREAAQHRRLRQARVQRKSSPRRQRFVARLHPRFS